MYNLEPVFVDAFYKIEADFEKSFVRAQWQLQIPEQDLRSGALRLREFLMESRLEYLLSNSQGLSSLSAETKNWLADEYYETLSLTNLKKLARVTPSNLFHQIALESVVTRAIATKHVSFSIRNFSNEDDALDWLFS